MGRLVTAVVTSPADAPREGLPVEFFGHDGSRVIAMTDAAGRFAAELVSGVTYDIPTENPVYVEGVAFLAGMMFRVTIPEGAGPLGIADLVASGHIAIINASRPALVRRIETVEAALGIDLPAPIPAPPPAEPERPRPVLDGVQ
jgi:hypothetical protein